MVHNLFFLFCEIHSIGWKHSPRLGCKPFQEKTWKWDFVLIWFSFFSWFKIWFQKILGCTWTLHMTKKLVSDNLRNFGNPVPLATERTRNTEIMESLLLIVFIDGLMIKSQFVSQVPQPLSKVTLLDWTYCIFIKNWHVYSLMSKLKWFLWFFSLER